MSVKEVMQLNSNFQLPLDELIVSRNLGFGDGRHGNFIFNGVYPYKKTEQGYYEVHSTYFEIPLGYTFRPADPCNALVIYSLSDILINGAIDMRGRGYCIDNGANAVARSFTVLGKRCDLALGGATVKSASGGDGGTLSIDGTTYKGGFGGTGSDTYIRGSHVTGGYCVPTYGKGAWFSTNGGDGVSYISYYNDSMDRNPAGVVVLIARGKIVIRGKIDCSATPGVAAQPGTAGQMDTSDSSVDAGIGGAGAQAPSGGGAITLIAKEIDRLGSTLNVSGKNYTNTTKGADSTGYKVFTSRGKTIYAYGGKGGAGTPAEGFTSQAGNIKEYLYWQ